jgi:hypothetical protein
VKGYAQDRIFKGLRLCKNFSQPSIRPEHKERIDGKTRERHAKPKTPHRIRRESGQLPLEALKKLGQLYHSRNPADLTRRIDKKLKAFFCHKKSILLRHNFLVMQ